MGTAASSRRQPAPDEVVTWLGSLSTGSACEFRASPWAVVDAAVAADRKENDRPSHYLADGRLSARTVRRLQETYRSEADLRYHHSSTHMDYYRSAVLREHRTASRGSLEPVALKVLQFAALEKL